MSIPRDTDLSGDDWRVLRGGSWGNGQANARAAYRIYLHPVIRYDLGGFRVARCSPI